MDSTHLFIIFYSKDHSSVSYHPCCQSSKRSTGSTSIKSLFIFQPDSQCGKRCSIKQIITILRATFSAQSTIYATVLINRCRQKALLISNQSNSLFPTQLFTGSTTCAIFCYLFHSIARLKKSSPFALSSSNILLA